MSSYPSYKDSGVEWIGEIPSGWDSRKLKHVAEMSKKKNDDGVKRRMLSVSQYFGIVEKQFDSEILERSAEESSGYWVVEDKDLVINTMWLNYRGLGVSDEISGYVSPGYRVYKLDLSRLNPHFVHYQMRSDLFVSTYTSLLRGIRPNSLQVGTYDFQHIALYFPPLHEQQQIVEFLDEKTQLIDSLVEKTEQKIELLKEQRTALINQAVTKGLDPNAEMKDSGVEWIGEIPSGWGFSIVSRHFYMERGRVIPKGELEEDSGKYPVYSSQTKKGGVFGYLNTYDFEGEYIAWTTDGAQCGTVSFRCGKFSTTNVCGLLSQENMGNELRYFAYLLNQITKPYVRVDINPKLMNNMMGAIPIIIPPLHEQQQIVEFLDEETARIDAIVEKETKRIELLKEYRQALISEVVTGNVDVREEVAA